MKKEKKKEKNSMPNFLKVWNNIPKQVKVSKKDELVQKMSESLNMCCW